MIFDDFVLFPFIHKSFMQAVLTMGNTNFKIVSRFSNLKFNKTE